jgi:FRG domain
MSTGTPMTFSQVMAQLSTLPVGQQANPSIAKVLAAYDTKNLRHPLPRFLFRGVNDIFSTMVSGFALIPAAKTVAIGQAYTLLRYAKRIVPGIAGYDVEYYEDALAILQHYVWPTPLIDWSGTLDVAAFFALLYSLPGRQAVIYVLDLNLITPSVASKLWIIDHDFITTPLKQGGSRHRWLRQDGFAATTPSWRMADAAQGFDMFQLGLGSALTAHTFTVNSGDRPRLRGLLSVRQDPMPRKLKSMLVSYCASQFGTALDPSLAMRLRTMYQWPD